MRAWAEGVLRIIHVLVLLHTGVPDSSSVPIDRLTHPALPPASINVCVQQRRVENMQISCGYCGACETLLHQLFLAESFFVESRTTICSDGHWISIGTAARERIHDKSNITGEFEHFHSKKLKKKEMSR